MRYQGHICPNCFDTGYTGGECRVCGYNSAYHERSVRALDAKTVLNGRYIIGTVLGEGGFGITYKACDVKAGRICAVKEYMPAGVGLRRPNGLTLEPASDRVMRAYQKGLARFTDEASILMNISSIPEVVTVHEFFQENGTAYYAMEFLDGANLNQIMRVSNGRMRYDDITNVTARVASAMQKVHESAHILHRDISPENIIVTDKNEVKIFDFGNAKHYALDQNNEFSVVLKLKYAPPEQHSQQMPQGPYTDIYSLAATYYYCVTGRNLPTAVDRLGGVSYIPLSQMNLGIPQTVSDAVDRALILDYSKRTQTMQEFLNGITNGAGVQNTDTQGGGSTGIGRGRILPYLEIISGQQMGTRWNLPADTDLVVGRSHASCHIAVDGFGDISRTHCAVHYDSRKELFYVQDLNSSYGTFIGGRRLTPGNAVQAKPPVNLLLAGSCTLRLGTELVTTS